MLRFFILNVLLYCLKKIGVKSKTMTVKDLIFYLSSKLTSQSASVSCIYANIRP